MTTKKTSKKPVPEKATPAHRSRMITGRAFMTFIIGAAMFTLGVFVGRGTAPVRFDMEKLQKDLTALRAKGIEKEQLQAKITGDAIDKNTGVKFHEELKKTEKGKGGRYDLEMNAPKPKDITPPEKAGATGKKTPAGAVKKTAATGGDYFIQVASLKEAAAADQLVARLKKKGYVAQRERKNVPNKGIWFRVRIGTFDNKAAADDILARLKKDKFGGMVMKR